MSKRLVIRLLGGLTISQEDQLVTQLSTKKAEVLLVYLAFDPRPHARELLATLLWDDRSQTQAFSNLRTLLTNLRQHLKPYLLITRQTVALNPDIAIWVDALEFERLLADDAWRTEAYQLDTTTSDLAEVINQLEEALALYQGEFVEGVFLRESRGLEEWIWTIRERLREQALAARRQLAHLYLYRRSYSRGIAHAQSLLTVDPLRESSHRLLMRLLVREGRLNAALSQYEQCRQVLDEELSVAPAAETTTLYERIRQAKQLPPLRLPPQFTPLIGRRQEMAAIGHRLDNPNCRLLTLVGTGGIGKTRLALQMASDRHREYMHGIFFVPLADVDTALLPAVVAAALGMTLEGKAPAQKQLLDYLRGRELLLVLDNFEHLGDEGTALVQAVLKTAPDVQLLVTSREPLHLRAEWLVPVAGLSFPRDEDVPAGEIQTNYEAVQLFLACAQPRQPGFALTGTTATAVYHICRLVQGLPLAIELAAAVLPQHTPAETVVEIQRNLDFLTTTMRDTPDRHRSMRATFEYSWGLLTAVEQRFFQQLSVFRGDFTMKAAAAITGDNIAEARSLLAALAGKSLVQPDKDGRYRLHELLRYYAAEKLAAMPDQKAAAQARHVQYYVAFLHALHPDLIGPKVVEAAVTVDADIENVREAWRQAIRQQDETAVAQALDALYAFYVTRCWYEEGDDMLGQAAAMLTTLPQTAERQLLTAKIWARQGKLCEITTFSKAERLYRQSLDLFQAQGADGETGLPLQGLGYLAYSQGDNAQARQYLQASLAAFEKANRPQGMAATLNTLAQVARREGEFQEAQRLCQQGLIVRRRLDDLKGVASSLNILGLILAETGDFAEALAALQESVALCRQLDNPIGLSNALANLVQVTFELGDKEAAWRYAEEGLALYRELGDLWGVAISLNNLGCLAEAQDEIERARKLLQESVTIYREIGIHSGLATSLGNLGDMCVALGRYEEAAASLLEGMRVSIEANDTPNTLLAVNGLAYLLLATGDIDRALPLLFFSRDHPKNRPWTKTRATRRLAPYLPDLPATQQARMEAESRALVLDDLVAQFLHTPFVLPD